MNPFVSASRCSPLCARIPDLAEVSHLAASRDRRSGLHIVLFLLQNSSKSAGWSTGGEIWRRCTSPRSERSIRGPRREGAPRCLALNNRFPAQLKDWDG
jgi:hypothetical protein